MWVEINTSYGLLAGVCRPWFSSVKVNNFLILNYLNFAEVSQMSSRLTSESRIYADKARDLNRQVSVILLLDIWQCFNHHQVNENLLHAFDIPHGTFISDNMVSLLIILNLWRLILVSLFRIRNREYHLTNKKEYHLTNNECSLKAWGKTEKESLA